MRKNGVDRMLYPIEGGVCAPEGYKANAVSCGLRLSGGLDFGMLFTEKRCAVACVYASGKTQGAPVKISKKNMRNGYARAVLVNGGVANALADDGEALGLATCDLFFPYGVERTEIVLASTGVMGERLRLDSFQGKVSELWQGLSSEGKQSAKLMEAISEEGAPCGELAFSFYLGDYPCRIGVIYKGGRYVAPNMATFLAFLTTDVNIATPMLQKALNAEVKETLNLINVGGAPSPNDTVCIFANGRAGNYKITCADSEYKKFTLALRLALVEVCKGVASAGGRKLFIGKVTGADSKEGARAVAKLLVGVTPIKLSLLAGDVQAEDILFSVLSVAYPLKVKEIKITLRSVKGTLVLYEAETRFQYDKEKLFALLGAKEVSLEVDFQSGNYAAVAYGCLE